LEGVDSQLASIAETLYNLSMRIISRRTLREFWEKHPDAEQPLRAWYANAKRANWRTPADVKTAYRNASLVANNRVVFNIKGKRYRLVVAIDYQYSIIYFFLLFLMMELFFPFPFCSFAGSGLKGQGHA